MNVSCPDCRSIFRVDPAKVPPSGVRARCSVCSGVISIPAPTGQTTPTGASQRTATPPESASQERTRSTPSAPPAQSGWQSTPFSGPPARPSAAAPGPRSAPSPLPPPRSVEASAAPRSRAEAGERAQAMATQTPPSPASGLPEFSPPPPVPPFIPGGPPATSGPSPFVPSSQPSRPVEPPRPTNTPPAASSPVSDGGARRPLNPFLSKDPNQRAKRLARALVSDIITYHPAKHAEGLRDGTLKQLFREEIKKSFEEYIAQVGQQLAESTTYFQEALNEVLGAGKKIF